MKQHEAIRILLHKAAQDETVLRALLANIDIDDETLGFHAQQALEKLLKAWLCHLGIDYPKTHNLALLIDLLEHNGHSLPDSLSDIDSLTPFATVFRYDALPLSEELDRSALLNQVETTRLFVQKQLENTPPIKPT